ncbi:EAL domain-containing protein [Paenibacillus sp. MMS20-IR301]|uniref:EAL domain-containing protein n=1 Tax=Paenibacillus sp. MMS20-IR301 TaxID=2895946 RepID=UPI0028E9B821|nr:EAL domain-containing protein [Paenibacillus sp. MMS20-IR301]WNS41840.1 EAL domain-containing protein [Paenibacillus sp. MMS20-IR301]
MNCVDCADIDPIEDEGELKLRPYSVPLAAAVRAAGYDVYGTGRTCIIPYACKEDLLGLIELLDLYQRQHEPALSLCIKGSGAAGSRDRWLTLDQLKVRFSSENLVSIIMSHDFCSFMQPIVDFREEIVGFELLLRPLPHGSYFQPYELFEIARRTGFHSFLDRAARISAIETSTRLLPKGIKRFINFLPSSIYNPKYCLTHTFETIQRLDQNPEDYVFEVVETEKISDISHLRAIFAEYRQQGMLVALDDVGAGYSTVEVMSSLQPDYVKIDRELISFCDQNTDKQIILKEIVSRAGDFGASVLAEGIERREEFLFCRDIGMDLGQGYLFGKPEDKPPAHFGFSA